MNNISTVSDYYLGRITTYFINLQNNDNKITENNIIGTTFTLFETSILSICAACNWYNDTTSYLCDLESHAHAYVAYMKQPHIAVL